MSIKEEAAKMKLASPLMASAPAEKRNSALLHICLLYTSDAADD